MRAILTTSVIAAVYLCAVPAQASSLGSESTGTMNITVVIPPLADAVRAQENGATGIWSIVNGNNGQIGRTQVCTHITNATLVCRILLDKNKTTPSSYY